MLAKAMSSSPENRRKHPRTRFSILVQYRLNSFEEFIAEYSVDLSPGGMFLRTEEPRDLGSMVYLQFQLKDGSKLIEGLGKVVWINEPGTPNRTPGMGIEFVNFDEESVALIQEICSSKAAAKQPKN